MDDAFQNALSRFVKNFAYGDGVRHLLEKGYTPERIKKEFHYPLSEEEIRKMGKNRKEERRKSNGNDHDSENSGRPRGTGERSPRTID